ncbi:flagellar basal body-associated FliL family protein [Roseovarius autotrophicus]|uniref:flagellar basal body-associated FliL family protein n=1 Tax=Roseovarius autotrophicus TaxID=2824121 RepID=UPI001A07B11B|nr:flagellar basal body-associated FliL family protein [Roseovarius autotrophicus]MBE0454791.1 flagellar basal body-associated FliL family protein [Roseovarius sp.]
MMRIVVPGLLLLLGLGAGIAAGLFLARPATEGDKAETAAPATEGVQNGGQTEFVRLNNQFVVPVVARDRVTAMVVMSLSVETRPNAAQTVYAREPKLRDGFLQVMFEHSNRGGFDGAFTNANNLDLLRRMLMEVARDLLGEDARGVLITEIARQDM